MYKSSSAPDAKPRSKFGAAALVVEWWPIEKVRPYSKNARKLSARAVGVVQASLKEFGWRQPIVVDVKGVIVVGHTRLLAAQANGEKQVPVHVARDLTAAQAKAYRLMDNRSNQETSWDFGLLHLELTDLRNLNLDLALTGFNPTELAATGSARTTGLTDCDAVPPTPRNPITRTGDLWLLGKHRVLCGDSTETAAIERLMAGAKADMLFMDPPYGVNLASTQSIPSRRRTDGAVIANDALDVAELTTFLRAAFAGALVATRAGAVWYVTAPHGPIGLAFSVTLAEIGVWRSSLVWVKDSLVMGRADFHYRHEVIYYGWSPGAAHHAVPTRDQDTVWEIPRPKRSPEHPTVKPIALIERALANSSNPADLVVDLFLGSGSSLIASEKTGRVCYGMEIAPRYVDVILQRWEAFTGRVALLDGGGTFAEVRDQRKATEELMPRAA
jgi:DNA modification methylase